jgi:hypothetical protein
MNPAAAIGLLIVILSFVLCIPFALIFSRRAFLRQLQPMRRVLSELTSDVLTNRSEKTNDKARGRVSIEGTIAEKPDIPIRVGVSYPPDLNSRYVSTGYKDYILPETTVTVGLLGATPRFELKAREKAASVADDVDRYLNNATVPSEIDFERAWKIMALNEELLNDELRTDLMRLLLKVRTLRSVRIDPTGLSISFTTTEKEELRAVADFAFKLRAKILASAEKRARRQQGGVRVELGYRVAADMAAEEEEEALEEEEAEAAGATYSSRRTS